VSTGKDGKGCPERRVTAFEPSSQNDEKFAQQIVTQTKVVCVDSAMNHTISQSGS